MSDSVAKKKVKSIRDGLSIFLMYDCEIVCMTDTIHAAPADVSEADAKTLRSLGWWLNDKDEESCWVIFV